MKNQHKSKEDSDEIKNLKKNAERGEE